MFDGRSRLGGSGFGRELQEDYGSSPKLQVPAKQHRLVANFESAFEGHGGRPAPVGTLENPCVASR
jgi:hypothetical protein